MDESLCPVCGNTIRDHDARQVVNGVAFHIGCVEAPRRPRRRGARWWQFGVRHQLAMGDSQREDQLD